jgi:UDP-N-acetylmuramate dehydrogenase
MLTLRKFLEKINIDAEIGFDEPMFKHTSFRIGGPADALVQPRCSDDLSRLLVAAENDGIPVTIIGGGANLLVADEGVRGIVVCTSQLRRFEVETTRAEPGSAMGTVPTTGGNQEATVGTVPPTGGDQGATGVYTVRAGAGLAVTELLGKLLDLGLSGMEFAAGLPGSVGGAVYMNARCYEKEMADLLDSVFYLDPLDHQLRHTGLEGQDWAYKLTPFMPGGTLAGAVITGARFWLHAGNKELMAARMAELEADRRAKGHFDYPCAGSLFKNDRRFGRPTGQILDELGFKGRRIGDAMVSRKHANIFVNAGRASAADMLALVGEAQAAAFKAFGFDLEPEVVKVGAFNQ